MRPSSVFSIVIGIIKKNAVGNVQYFREDKKVDLEKEEGGFASREELDAFRGVVFTNAAVAHLALKNWGHARDDAANLHSTESFGLIATKNSGWRGRNALPRDNCLAIAP